jgi:autotransporter-associated beta strand protein
MTLSGGTQAFSGVISGAVSLALNLTSSSALTLSGANTYSGATMVSAGTLFVTGSLASDVAVNANATLGGGGTVGALSFDGGSYFDIFDAISGNPLDSITIGIGSAGFGIDNLVSQGAAVNWGAIADGTYNLITGTLDSLNLDNFGLANAFDIDGISGSRSAYFQNGSLQLVVIPEPHAALLGGLSLLALLRRRRKY